MKIRNFLAGLLLGTAVALFFSSQHYNAVIEENAVREEDKIVKLILNYQGQLDALKDGDEQCTELFERTIELELRVMQLEGIVLQEQINCRWKLEQAEKERCP